ncbi:hypothetical protein DICPUDRAFT_97732 [Dictyostelium purpureum]|uniref:Uncharacterized protein n=1 Tax=Dictyostelium purpureum TaxID=5786 RepID=F0ZJB8_DICPU|nr:uncharacterized protein DICPUDRAFT_97732 [Dictyostelium purpureum]EGC35935.1 hypothetical protein DICPUDRAFT_97732 [Dictyostelium purpureum]|eukprot:XP_003287508.1 hypothetical protein DICPUDRAFT_97732 [Dictyostelium purpureum]
MNDNINNNLGNEIIRLCKARIDVKREVIYRLKTSFQSSFLNQSKFFLEEAWNFINQLDDPEIYITSVDNISCDYHDKFTRDNECFRQLKEVVDTLASHQKTLQQIRFLKTQQQQQQQQNNTLKPMTLQSLQSIQTSLGNQQQTSTSALQSHLQQNNDSDQNEKWIKDLLFSVIQLKQYYSEFIDQIIKYLDCGKIGDLNDIMEGNKATISSESFPRPFYRINRSTALKILNLNEHLEPLNNDKSFSPFIFDNNSPINSPFLHSSISNNNNNNNNGSPSSNSSPFLTSTSPSINLSQCSTPGSPHIQSSSMFWKQTKSIYFNKTNLADFGKDITVNKLYQLLNIPFAPTSLLVVYIDNSFIDDHFTKPQLFYTQAFWGVDGRKFEYDPSLSTPSKIQLNTSNSSNSIVPTDISIISFAEQVFGTLLICPKENHFQMVQLDDANQTNHSSGSISPHVNLQNKNINNIHSISSSPPTLTTSLPPLPPSISSSPPPLLPTSTLSLLTPHPLIAPISICSSLQSSNYIPKSYTLISIKNDQLNFEDDDEIIFNNNNSPDESENNLFSKLNILKLPQMDKTVPSRFQKYICNINSQFLIVQWLTKLEEFNNNFSNLLKTIKFINQDSQPFLSSSLKRSQQRQQSKQDEQKINEEESSLSSSASSTSALSINSSVSSSPSSSPTKTSAKIICIEELFLKFNLPIKLNRKTIETVQKRFETIQNQLKKNSNSTFSDLFLKVYPLQFVCFKDLTNNETISKKSNFVPIITITSFEDNNKIIKLNNNLSSSPGKIKSSKNKTLGVTINNSNNQSNTNDKHAKISHGKSSSFSFKPQNPQPSENSTGGSICKSHSSSFSANILAKSRTNSSLNLYDYVSPQKLLLKFDIDRFKLAESVFQEILVHFHLDSKKVPLNVIYNKITLLQQIRATHFSQPRSIIELYRLISKHLKNQNQINIFNTKFKPIFKQIAQDNPNLQLNWILIIEEWFSDEWENPKQLFPRQTREIKGSFFGKRLLPQNIHDHLFSADGKFIRRNKYGRKDVSWYPETDPIWYFKKYPEIPGYEFASAEFMRGLGVKNMPFSELVLFYDPILKKSYPVLLSLAVNGKLVSDIWGNKSSGGPSEINESILDQHHNGILIISSMLLTVEDQKDDNLLLTENGRYLVPIDNDHCFVPPYVVDNEKSSIIKSFKGNEQKKKLQMKSLLFNLNMMKDKIPDSVKQQFLNLNCFEFLKDWLEKLTYIHDRYSTLLPEEELQSLYQNNACIVRVFFTTNMIQQIFNNLLTIQYCFKYSITNTFMDLFPKIVDPFVAKKYQSIFDNPNLKTLEERFKATLAFANQNKNSSNINNHIQNNLSLINIVKVLNIPNQDLYGESVRIKNQPSIALNHLKEIYKLKQDVKNMNEKILLRSNSSNIGSVPDANRVSNSFEMLNTINCNELTKKQYSEFEKKFRFDFSSIESCSIHNSLFTDSFIKKLSFSHIQFLDLTNSEKLTRLSLGYLLKITPELLYLNISGWKTIKRITFFTNTNFEMGLIDINQLITLEDESQIPPNKIQRLVINDCANLELIDLFYSMPSLRILDANRNPKIEKIRINYNVKLNTDISDPDFQIIKKKQLNYIVLGDKNVGKTSLIKIIKNKTNLKNSHPNFFEANLDSPLPQEVLKAIENKLSFNCFCDFGIILVYDCNIESSIISCRNWYNNFKKVYDPNNYIKVLLVGNKNDLPSNITEEDINKFAKEFSLISLKKNSSRLSNSHDEFSDICSYLTEKCCSDCKNIK